MLHNYNLKSSSEADPLVLLHLVGVQHHLLELQRSEDDELDWWRLPEAWLTLTLLRPAMLKIAEPDKKKFSLPLLVQKVAGKLRFFFGVSKVSEASLWFLWIHLMHKLKIIKVRLMRIFYTIPSAMINKVIAETPVNTVRWKWKLRNVIFLVKFTVSKEKSFILYFFYKSQLLFWLKDFCKTLAQCVWNTKSQRESSVLNHIFLNSISSFWKLGQKYSNSAVKLAAHVQQISAPKQTEHFEFSQIHRCHICLEAQCKLLHQSVVSFLLTQL